MKLPLGPIGSFLRQTPKSQLRAKRRRTVCFEDLDRRVCLSTTIGGVNLGDLPNYLFFFANGSKDANWQGATKGFAGDVAVNGIVASERTSGGVPFAGTIYTNDSTLGAWQKIVDQNSGQAFASTGQTTRISNLTSQLNSAFSQINGLSATSGFTSRSAASLDGLNTQDGVGQTIVINVTSGFQVTSKINITGDANDVFILRWDTDANPANGYQGQVKFQSGGAIVPHGGLTAGNFIHVAGDLSASGGGGNPAAPYPQGPRLNDGQGNLINGGSNFSGGGFFTGYWLTTGDPATGETHPFSNAIFVGGWYTLTNKFSMTSGTSGVHVPPPKLAALGDFVWWDKNANGIQDAGEPGIPGATVNLKNSSGAVIATTTTNANGIYGFTGLAAGTYSVQFVQPTGLNSVSPVNQGSNDAVDSDADPSMNLMTAPVTLQAGETNLTLDAGFYKAADLSITKTDGKSTYTPGGTTTYTIVVKNNGDLTVNGAKVVDNFPSIITSDSWTTSTTGGATVAQASGTGNINTTVNLPAGATVTFTVVAHIAANGGSSTKTVDFTSLGSNNTTLAQNVTVNGIRADAFYISGGSYLTTNTHLFLRNQTNDHGLGVLSNGETGSLGGDQNELSNELNLEVIRLQKPTGERWTSLWVSSLDPNGSGGAERGTLFWSNSATPDLSTLSSRFSFKFSDFGTSEEGNLLSLHIPNFNTDAKYLFFRAGPNPSGTNNDYLVWKASTVKPPNLVNTASVFAPSGIIDSNPDNNSDTDTDTPGVLVIP